VLALLRQVVGELACPADVVPDLVRDPVGTGHPALARLGEVEDTREVAALRRRLGRSLSSAKEGPVAAPVRRVDVHVDPFEVRPARP
jgi:hypothetical protein